MSYQRNEEIRRINNLQQGEPIRSELNQVDNIEDTVIETRMFSNSLDALTFHKMLCIITEERLRQGYKFVSAINVPGKFSCTHVTLFFNKQ